MSRHRNLQRLLDEARDDLYGDEDDDEEEYVGSSNAYANDYSYGYSYEDEHDENSLYMQQQVGYEEEDEGEGNTMNVWNADSCDMRIVEITEILNELELEIPRTILEDVLEMHDGNIEASVAWFLEHEDFRDALSASKESDVVEQSDSIPVNMDEYLSSRKPVVSLSSSNLEKTSSASSNGESKGNHIFVVKSNKSYESQESKSSEGAVHDSFSSCQNSPSCSLSTSVKDSNSQRKQSNQEPVFVADLDAIKAELEAMSIDDEGRTRLNMVIVGHVDSGKSTMMGHLLFLLNLVDSKTMHKYEKQSTEIGKGSFAFAWVMDSGSSERSRGVTTDIAVRHFNTPTKSVTLLDSPGHRDFVPNMISGAAQADVAILVVDSTMGAFESGFESGQTREHAMLVRSLGASDVIVAVNKLDLSGWDETRFDEIRDIMSSFLTKIGYRENRLHFVPVSGLQGQNMLPDLDSQASSIPSRLFPSAQSPRPAALSCWYSGPSLCEVIDHLPSPERQLDVPSRLVVSDVYKTQQLGVAVGGKIESGVIRVGDELLCMPVHEKCIVRKIERHGRSSRVALAGDNVELGLSDIDINALTIGSILCDPRFPVFPCRKLGLQCLTFDISIPLLRGTELMLFSQSTSVPVTIRRIYDVVTGKKLRVLGRETAGILEVEADRTICIEEFKKCKSLGRVALRDVEKIVAAGIVTKAVPRRRKSGSDSKR